jgi:hypothetical protein
MMQEDPNKAPDLLQRPLDDGAGNHLLGLQMPPMAPAVDARRSH